MFLFSMHSESIIEQFSVIKKKTDELIKFLSFVYLFSLIFFVFIRFMVQKSFVRRQKKQSLLD